MGQRGLLRTVFVERRTLSTVPMALRFRLVPPIRAHFVELECRAQLLWLEDEGLAERLNIARLGLPITLALQLPLLALQFLLVFVLAQPLLEEGRDGVGDALELLVALGLGGLEATCDMSPDEGHRDRVGTRAIGVGYAGGGARLRLDGVEDGFGGEHEGTWRLSSRQARIGHEGAVSRRGEGGVGARGLGGGGGGRGGTRWWT